MTSTRAALAGLVVALWLGGLAMLHSRNANVSEAQQLAQVALRLQPETFYYIIDQKGEHIGAASSAVDTTINTLIGEEYFVGDLPGRNGLERTSARWQTRLTRGFRLTDFGINIARLTRPFAINASVQEDTLLFIAGSRKPGGRPSAQYTFTRPLFTPSLAPVAFMLGGDHTIGRKQTMSVFDPITRLVIRPELTIRAESLFTVVDSASQNEASEWVPAHRDTVRAWRLDGAPHGLTAWVDGAGRIVSVQAGDFSATRTAFEIAFKNAKVKTK
jgi:hypothetical protein